MRMHWIAVAAALALLGGCNSANQGTAANPQGKNDAPAAPAIAPGTAINGTVTFHDQIPIAQGSKLDVKLVDIAQPEISLAEKVFDVGGAPPFNFSLDFDPAKINATRTYVINALLTDGPRKFVPALNSPVLTHGATTTVQVVLNAEATPAEKLKEEFNKLQAHIGGMKKVAGTYTTDDSSVGWDGFAEGASVRFVRVNTEFDKGGRTSAIYAYKNDKPMVVKQKGGSTVGWGDDGNVLWNEKAGGGEVDGKEINSMRDGALKVLSMAQEKVEAAKKK
jgi:putative lipoprotein